MRRPLFGALAAAVALILALTGCAAAPAASSESAGGTVSVTHARGTLDAPANPAKIVVIDHASLDTIKTLGFADRVVGTPKRGLPSSLENFATDAVTDVGTLQEPDVEKIAELNPDVIVIGGRTAPKYDELAKLAPTLDMSTASEKPVEELRERAVALGRLLGAEDKAVAEADAVAKLADETKALATGGGQGGQGAGKALILLTTGGKVSAYGPGARFGSVIHDTLGVPAAAPNLKKDRHGQAVSFEFIAQTNPDRLFVIDRDAAIGQQGKSAQQVLDNPLVAGTNAWKNKQVTYLDGGEWYAVGSGLTTMRSMIENVRGALSS